MTYHARYSPRFTNLPHDGKILVPENSTFVVDVQSEDNKGSEQNGQLKYKIIGGVDAEFFKIDKHTGVLEFISPPDFENDQSNYNRGDNIYDVKIQVEDAAHYTAHKTLWIMVTDVDENINEKPKFTNLPDDGVLMVHENNTFVIDAEASDDKDSEGNGLKYSIVGGVDKEFFEIDMTTGELSFKSPPDFENDQSNYNRGDNVYDVKIRVEDSHGAFHDKSLWVKVKDVDETPEDPILPDGTYQLCNHPDGNAASPLYGLRLDGLTTGDTDDIFTFDFEHPDADMRITVEGDSVRIFGVAFGGLDIGDQYDPNNSGLWEIDFTYNNVQGLAGDDDLIVEGLDPKSTGTNTGVIKQLFGDQQTYDLTEFANMDGSSFFLGDGDDDQGHRNFDGISGWGWLEHSGSDDRLAASDWLFTVKPEPLQASIGDKVFLDEDGDGVQDPGEAGVEGVTVTITGAGDDGVFGTGDDTEVVTATDADGNYASGDLAPGDYKVTFSDLPDGFEFTTPNVGGDEAADSDADPTTGMTDVISLEGGDVNKDVDAGLVAPVDPAQLGDRVFFDADRDGVQDPDEEGVSGVTVTIDGAGADGIFGTGDDIQIVTSTDADGFYGSDDIPPGDYKVTFSDLPDGFEFTTPNVGGDEATDSDADPTTGMTGVITLAEGEVNNDVDAGVVAPVVPGSIGDTVFLDSDRDGVQDPGEEGVEGVTVTITGAGTDGIFGTGDDTEVVTTTDENGNYDSGDLAPGDYKVTFSDLPNGFEFTTPNVGGDEAADSDADPANGMTDIITIGEGEVNNDVDAGVVAPVVPGSIGDTVFLDSDRDGVQDPGEEGVEGVTVTITGAGTDGIFGTGDDTEVVTTTDENGNYDSGDLAPGDYKVTFSDLPDGFEFTTPNVGGDEAADSDADPANGMTDIITIGEGEVNNDVDAGVVAPLDPAHLGNKVFLDANRNGVQDPGEDGVSGVTVTIDGAGEDGVFGTDDDIQIVTETNVNGFYRSGDIPPGDYKVTFSDLPDGFEFTTPNVGGDDTVDSDADPANGMTEVITLGEGESNNTVDAGVVAPIAPGSIGDTVFLDADRDGVQDPGEDGVEGVTVTITGAGDDGVFGTGDDTEVVTTTDENGNYDSGDLAPGDYKVTFSDLPDGFEFTSPNVGGDESADSDADPTNGMTDVITIGEGEVNNDVDAGVVAPIIPARLGNQVFDDRNQNGIRDRGEQGVQGVTVTLTGGGDDGLISTTDDNTEEVQVTRERGRYFFNDLTPGTEYKVTFSDLPNGFVFTAQDQGTNDARDSDADPVTGMTDIIILEPGEVNPTVDAGIVFTLTPEKNFIRGTIAPDFLPGTSANDDIRGLGDSDTINGFEGNDCLFGNGGFDNIRGGSGSDTIFGGRQDDTLRGDGGNDMLFGGVGNDELFGGGGRDVLDGTNGSGANELDTLTGNGGADVFVLGDVISQYYIAAGDNDFATINGFDAAADTIQLNGVADDYSTQQNGSDLELRSNGELIAVFTNTNDLDLNAVGNFV